MSEQARLRWLCRRGMKELDLVMSRYLDRYYATASSAQQAQFKALLEMPDPELYSLLLGRSRAAEPALEEMAQFLRQMSSQE